MRIGKVSLKNFQSYKTLEFDFYKQGLVGIFGTTGAGKSTLLDAVAWILFGVTGKGGAADDVRPWDTNDPTSGNAMVETNAGWVGVTRTRAPGKNDLCWVEYGPSDGCQHPGDFTRGKDLKDTQKKLEERLGVTAELFLLSGYMTQFSEADSFFLASAKDRRIVLEKIADQEFAIRLGERASEDRKAANKALEDLKLQNAKIEGELESLKRSLQQTTTQATQWDKNHAIRLQEIEKKCFSYAADIAKKAADWDSAKVVELDRLHAELSALPECRPSKEFDAEIAALKAESRCPTCNALSDKHSEHIARIREEKFKNAQLEEKAARLCAQYQAAGAVENPHQLLENPYEIQFQDLKSAVNPFSPNLEIYLSEIYAKNDVCTSFRTQMETLSAKVKLLTWLYDKSFELRGLMMERVVGQIEEKTNYYLDKFFDGVLRVRLSCQDSDKIEAVILNEGHRCPFTSISGGERCMLKLAFNLSIMRAAQNKAGVSLNCVMLDEPLNGLPEDLKVKAFGLFDELTNDYSTVLVIDHSTAFQNCFTSSFFVDKSSGFSALLDSA